jgi:hypothetical protein
MFFACAIARIGLKFYHRHIAAYDIAESVLNQCDNLAAYRAFIEFHNCTSLSFTFVALRTIPREDDEMILLFQ